VVEILTFSGLLRLRTRRAADSLSNCRAEQAILIASMRGTLGWRRTLESEIAAYRGHVPAGNERKTSCLGRAAGRQFGGPAARLP